MPKPDPDRLPRYRLHQPSGRAVVTLPDGLGRRRTAYLGAYDSPESRAEYDRVVAEWLANGRRLAPATGAAGPSSRLTVAELVLAWDNATATRYGPESREPAQFKLALRPLLALYGRTPAAEFGPKNLKAVRRRMIDLGWSLRVVNRQVTRVKTLFKWAAEEELVPGTVSHALQAVRRLPPNAPGVRARPGVRPADWPTVEKVLPFCPPPVATMLRLQWLAGLRSAEVRVMRTLDIDRSDPRCWRYRPGSDAGPFGRHKNSWRSQTRVIALGPEVIAVLWPWLRPDEPAAYLFSPRRRMEQFRAERRARRKTRVPPGQRDRRAADPKKRPGESYTRDSYAQAVRRAARRAGVRLHPGQLRHSCKMRVAAASGSEAARCVLGHRSIETTTHYGEVDVGLATAVMQRLG